MSLVKSGFAPVNGLQMYYEIHGNGKPLVLIHGGGSTIQSNWGKMIPIFSRSRQVIAVEMQAHGRTADIDRDFTFEQDADDIASLIKYLGLPKADILGFSNGGQTAIQLAARHPEVVDKLIITSIGYTREGFQPWFWPGMQAATFDNMPQALKDAFQKANPDREQLLKMFHRDSTRMNNFQSWSNDLLKSIEAPSLIVAGDNDIITPEHAVEMFRLIAGSRLAIFPGTHGDFLGEVTTGNTDIRLHEAFATIVLNFLDSGSR